MLRQVVCYLVPRRFGFYEDVGRRPYGGRIYEGAEGDVSVCAIADYGKEQRPARSAAGVMSIFVPEDQQIVATLVDIEFAALDPGEGLER